MPVYSHSRLSTFENCPLQYKYRYIDRIRTDWQSIEAFMGKCVHEVLEGLYKDLDRARNAGLDPLLDRFRRLWESKLSSAVHVVRPDLDADYYRDVGARCLRTFWERNHPFAVDPKQIIGVEMRVEMSLDPARRYRMMGFIDRAQRAEPGVIEIHDYKTSSSLPREGSLRYDRQLPLYEIALRQKFPETAKVRLIWHFLAHGREFTEERTEKDLERVKRLCIVLIQTVERAREFPAKKGPLCAWCEYQEMCPEWKDARPSASPAFPGGRPQQPPPRSAPSRSDGASPSASAPASPGPVSPAAPEHEVPSTRPTDRPGRSAKPTQLRLF